MTAAVSVVSAALTAPDRRAAQAPVTPSTAHRSRIAIGNDADSSLDRARGVGFTVRMPRRTAIAPSGGRACPGTVLTQRRVIDHGIVNSAGCRSC